MKIALPKHLQELADDLAREMLIQKDPEQRVMLMKIAMNMAYNHGRDVELLKLARRGLSKGGTNGKVTGDSNSNHSSNQPNTNSNNGHPSVFGAETTKQVSQETERQTKAVIPGVTPDTIG